MMVGQPGAIHSLSCCRETKETIHQSTPIRGEKNFVLVREVLWIVSLAILRDLNFEGISHGRGLAIFKKSL